MRTVLAAGMALVLLFLGLAGGLVAGSERTLATTITQTVTGTETTTTASTTETEVAESAAGIPVVTITVLHEGFSLVSVNGTGNENSAPFTASSNEVALNWTLSDSSNFTALSWYIYPINSTTLFVQQGGVTAANGTQSSLAYGLTPGQEFYVSVLAANVVWAVTVNPVD
jgi:hypothetical protein